MILSLYSKAVYYPTFLDVQLPGEAARPAGGDVEGVVVGPTQPLTVTALHLHTARRFCSFGAVGECAKHAYAPSPTAHNAFSLTS